MDIDAICEDPRWQASGLPSLAHRAVGAVLTHLELPTDAAQVSVLGCDDAKIAVLNAEFRAKDSPTNVLSWPAQDVVPPDLPTPDIHGELALGDLAIAFETCEKEAQDQGKPFTDHVTHLLVHGTLHLLGYDHERDIDATLMEGLEVEILGKLGLPDPY